MKENSQRGLNNLVRRVFSLSNMAAAGEDPGTQQKSRDRFVHEESKFIQHGDWWKTNKMAAKANFKKATNMQEFTYKQQEYGRMI